MPEEKRIEFGETIKGSGKVLLTQGVDGCAPGFHSKRIWSLPQWEQKTVTSDLDQLQSAKPAEMNNSSDQEQCHRKMGWLLERTGSLEKN